MKNKYKYRFLHPVYSPPISLSYSKKPLSSFPAECTCTRKLRIRRLGSKRTIHHWCCNKRQNPHGRKFLSSRYCFLPPSDKTNHFSLIRHPSARAHTWYLIFRSFNTAKPYATCSRFTTFHIITSTLLVFATIIL